MPIMCRSFLSLSDSFSLIFDSFNEFLSFKETSQIKYLPYGQDNKTTHRKYAKV